MITVLAEKPSVAKDIATYLGATNKKNGYFEGNNYRVTWAYGHQVQIKDLKELGYTEKWCLSNLPFIPNNLELKVKDDNGAKAQFTIIKELFNTSSSLLITFKCAPTSLLEILALAPAWSPALKVTDTDLYTSL